MTDFTGFVRLGAGHILSPTALDHLLFLLALVAPYRPRDWRHLTAVATAFTVGHSLTLALVVLHLVALPTALIEFLIPLTIVGAGVETLRRPGQVPAGWVRPLLAGGFGLIHGAGFANILREMFVGPPAGPLLAFNIGIELGQLAVLGILLPVLAAVDRGLGAVGPRAPRYRRLAASAVAAGWALVLAAQRTPW
jgi:hypothetical protein